MAVNSYNPLLMFAPASSAYPLDGDVGVQPGAKKWPVEGVDQDQQTMKDIAEGVQILSKALGVTGVGEAAGATSVFNRATGQAGTPGLFDLFKNILPVGGQVAKESSPNIVTALGRGRPDLGKYAGTEGMLPAGPGKEPGIVRKGVQAAGDYLKSTYVSPVVQALNQPLNQPLADRAGRKAMRDTMTPAINYSQLPLDNSNMTTPPEMSQAQASTPAVSPLEIVSPVTPRTHTPAKATEPTAQVQEEGGGRNIGQTAGSLVKLLGSSFLGDYAQNPAIAQVAQQIAYDALGELGWLSPQAEAEMAESKARTASYEASTKKLEQMTPFEMVESLVRSQAGQFMGTQRGILDIGTRKMVEGTEPEGPMEWEFNKYGKGNRRTGEFTPWSPETQKLMNVAESTGMSSAAAMNMIGILSLMDMSDESRKNLSMAPGGVSPLTIASKLPPEQLEEKAGILLNLLGGGQLNIPKSGPKEVENFGGKK